MPELVNLAAVEGGPSWENGHAHSRSVVAGWGNEWRWGGASGKEAAPSTGPIGLDGASPTGALGPPRCYCRLRTHSFLFLLWPGLRTVMVGPKAPAAKVVATAVAWSRRLWWWWWWSPCCPLLVFRVHQRVPNADCSRGEVPNGEMPGAVAPPPPAHHCLSTIKYNLLLQENVAYKCGWWQMQNLNWGLRRS